MTPVAELEVRAVAMKAIASHMRYDIDEPAIQRLIDRNDIGAVRALQKKATECMARERLGAFELLLSCMRNKGEVAGGTPWHWHLSICQKFGRPSQDDQNDLAEMKRILGGPENPVLVTTTAKHYQWPAPLSEIGA